MEAQKYKIPNDILQKIKGYAPTYTVSENYSRRGGFYGDEDEEASGYKSVCIYVQNGLANRMYLFKEILKAIFKIQSDNLRKYPLIVFGFGETPYLQCEKKYLYKAWNSIVTVYEANPIEHEII